MKKLIELGVDENLLKLDGSAKTEIEYWLFMIQTGQASSTDLNKLLKKRIKGKE